MKGFAVSSAILGAVTGPLFGLLFTERLGRRKTMMSSQIYIAELSPPHMRSVLVNVNQLSNVIGINLAVIVGYIFSFEGWGWRWMFMAQAVPVVIFFSNLLSF